MNFKICSKCNQDLPIGNFCKFARSKDGFKAWCKTCSNSYMQQYRATKPEYRAKELRYQRERSTQLNEDKILSHLQKAIERCKINNVNIPREFFETENIQLEIPQPNIQS